MLGTGAASVRLAVASVVPAGLACLGRPRPDLLRYLRFTLYFQTYFSNLVQLFISSTKTKPFKSRKTAIITLNLSLLEFFPHGPV